MKRALYFVAVALVILMVAAAGCQCKSNGRETEIRLAPIHEIQVNIAESYPLQVIVFIKGGLADSCTTFHELTTEHSDSTINITVTTERPKDAVCAQVYSFFEQNVNLGSNFISGDTYTINVNDRATSFVMP